MPSFRTELPLSSFPFEISHKEMLLSIGSCFTEHIGERLSTLKFKQVLNPFGIVYNPISIAEQLKWLMSENSFTERDLFENQGLWHSFAHHGSYSSLQKGATLQKINESLQLVQSIRPQVTRLLITLGTAQVFVYKESGKIVANCHKLPGQVFEKRRLAVSEITDSLLPVLQQLKVQQPDLQVIFTVSPVRHIRDGLIENQRSKATLLLAIDLMCSQLDFVHYFPAYELVLDDLRDYRFFEADMIHPNEVAIDYVWQRFGEAFFDKNTQELLVQIEAIVQASRHRPFHPQSAPHQAFVQKQLEKIHQLEKQYSFLDFALERQAFQKQLGY